MIFQEFIARRENIHTLQQSLQSEDPLTEFVQQWQLIEEDIDFIPIFRVAENVLLSLPSTPETYQAIRHLGDSALFISRNSAALRHDLMGRIFHRLLADAKYYGAFYTKIPAATILLELAIHSYPSKLDWKDPSSINQLRIADLSCGTGTLLKAGLSSILNKHIDECVRQKQNPSIDAIHRSLIENSIWGFDVIPSAIHLAATSLAIHDPNVDVNQMHLYAVPLGGPSNRLGSIEISGGRRLDIQQSLIGADLGLATPTSDEASATRIPILNICAMNPPFTRSVYGNFLFKGIESTDRRELQNQLRSYLNETHLQANITAGLGSVFVAVGDRLLDQNGIFALVLPKTVLSGSSWEPTRGIFKDYKLKYVISSHEPNNWDFSESVDFSEVLLVLVKELPSNQDATTYVNLWSQPKTSIEALACVDAILRTPPADINALTGISEIRTNGTKFGEILNVNLHDGKNTPWSLAANFAQTDLCRVASCLNRSSIFIPGLGQVGRIRMTQLSNRARLGPDGRDIYDGFALTDTRTTYSALWGHDAQAITRISQSPNQYLAPLVNPLPGRNLRDANVLWRRAGSLMLTKELWLPTNSVVGTVLPRPSLSNVWWPTRWISEDQHIRQQMERRLSLWFNSTLGILTLLMQREETKGAWIKFPKTWYEDLKILDLNLLTDEQNDQLDQTYQEISDSSFLPFPQINQDPIRAQIDETFSNVLGLPPLDELRELLSREPMISMEIP
jgi:hypothetical protein